MTETADTTMDSVETTDKKGILHRVKDKIVKALLFPFYTIYKRYLWKKLNTAEKPKHLGIILDGNRRYSRAHGLDIWAGHELGAKKVEEVLAYCWELGIKIVTLYTFSIENFNRPKEEVDKIMELAKKRFTDLMTHPLIFKYKVRIKALGRMELLPLDLQETIRKAEETTSQFHDYQLNIAIAYSGRSEIVDAVRAIIKNQIQDINEESFPNYLYTAGLPDPDLIIRTSGEIRVSGFLIWQAAYSELYFCDIYWPAFRKIDIWRAVRAYQKRHRRYGL